MAEYDSGHHNANQISKETTLQAINTIIQLHFEKTLEKKKSVDLQKKELWKLFQLFFLFLALVFAAQVQSPRLQCRHCWIPIGLLSLAHLIFYVSVAQTLRCINGFKYQRRCHKLTLGLATERLRQIRIRLNGDDGGGGGGGAQFAGDEFEIHYQEPPESYFGLGIAFHIHSPFRSQGRCVGLLSRIHQKLRAIGGEALLSTEK